ncbi:WxL domain-containing protein, partial [Enterococcus sp. 5H]|uniref:WxL domain-containing protein n=1 Tax=Enterococcus sp. 5H TaxID=1229490 RepID=UPI002303EDC1
MNMQKFKAVNSLLLILAGLTLYTPSVHATTDSLGQTGTVTVEGSSISNPIDPENPGEVIDPGEGPSTEGPLRIDYVSSLDFGRAQLTDTNR